jgi:glycosyltransferase involved in cell wall biosynthesis
MPVETPIPILFVDHAGPLGGAEKSLLLLMETLDRDEFACHLAAPPGAFAEAAERAGARVHRLVQERLRGNPAAWLPLARGALALARVIRREKIAVVHANTVRASLYSAVAAKLTRRPLVWHVHDILRPGPYTRFLAACSTATVAVSEAAASPLPRAAAATILHNGVRLDDFARDRGAEVQQLRAAWRVPPGAPLLGQVARLQPWKGQHDFIDAASRVAGEFPEARFVIVGGDIFGDAEDYARELRDQAARVGLADRMVFAGHCDEIPVVFGALDVLVHASDNEPFGRVLIESGAAGRPVVAYASGAVSELLRHEHSALFAAPGNVDDLAQALRRLLREPELAGRLGRNGRAEVARRFDITRLAQELAGILRRVGGHPARAARP